MGMDVIGRKNPDAYFRNNVWWWRPLWDYCNTVAPHLCGKVNGHFNDGDGLDEEDALELAEILKGEIYSDATAKYEARYNARLAALPRHECNLCNGTGIRTDGVGVDMGMPKKELPVEVQILVGRTHGWCNSCNGEGTTEDWETSYPFSSDNVLEFIDFLDECGGFSIC